MHFLDIFYRKYRFRGIEGSTWIEDDGCCVLRCDTVQSGISVGVYVLCYTASQ